jgi:predicted HTH domain antitoxin
MQLTITIPDSLPDSLQATPGEFERKARMAMAVKLYERRRTSSGIAARLVDMDRATFLLELHRYGAASLRSCDDRY